jgi:hypothetical protein
MTHISQTRADANTAPTVPCVFATLSASISHACVQPLRVAHPVIEKSEDDDAQNQRRYRLEHEQPLPPGDARVCA